MTENQRMNDKELKEFSIKLMKKADICYLSTINEDSFPETRAVFNLRYEKEFQKLKKFFSDLNDNLVLYFATNTSSRKLNHINNNPKGCAYYCSPDQFMGLYLSGNLEIIDDINIKKTIWQQGWDFYYRESTKDHMDKDYTILRLKPMKMRVWYRGKYEYNF